MLEDLLEDVLERWFELVILGGIFHSILRLVSGMVVIVNKSIKMIENKLLLEKMIEKLEKYKEIPNRDRFILPPGENILFFIDAVDEIFNNIQKIIKLNFLLWLNLFRN